LYIYPEQTSYSNRDFIFRISTAKVETSESTFTQLPNIHREIMILDGELKIVHEGHHTKIVQKFDTDSFSGSWNTKGFGVVTDFNLMTTGKAKGNLNYRKLNAGDVVTPAFLVSQQYIGYYLLNGSAELEYDDKKTTLNKHDFIIVSNETHEPEISIKFYEATDLVETIITIF
ncbi:MAG: HutD family protein, partial [Bacteroidota bacterium]